MLKRESVQLIRDGDEEPIILADSNRTLQILVNLIRNACQSLMQIHHGNRILKLSITSDAGKAFITVSDNGVGISEENMAKIFTYGFTTKTGGHGFGLHSAMFAAREMNCSITVKSDGPNQGATFILELPLATATPKQPKIRLNKTQPILTHEIL
jgi:C4-dicarboxylate-specific signal transduction histidine kinase